MQFQKLLEWEIEEMLKKPVTRIEKLKRCTVMAMM
jgi:hypothetical protein